MAFCTHCGAPDQSGHFCSHCGGAISPTSQVDTPQTAGDSQVSLRWESAGESPVQHEPQKNRSGGVIGFVIALVVIAVFVAVVLSSTNKTSPSSTDSQSSVEGTSEETDPETVTELVPTRQDIADEMTDAVFENWGSNCYSTSDAIPEYFTVWSRWIGDVGLVSLTDNSDGTGWSGVSFQVRDEGNVWQVTQTNDSPLEDDPFAAIGVAPYECDEFSVSK